MAKAGEWQPGALPERTLALAEERAEQGITIAEVAEVFGVRLTSASPAVSRLKTRGALVEVTVPTVKKGKPTTVRATRASAQIGGTYTILVVPSCLDKARRVHGGKGSVRV